MRVTEYTPLGRVHDRIKNDHYVTLHGMLSIPLTHCNPSFTKGAKNSVAEDRLAGWREKPEKEQQMGTEGQAMTE